MADTGGARPLAAATPGTANPVAARPARRHDDPAAIMMKPRFTRDQPRELARTIIEAIDRVAPGRGDEIYL
jgi:hypothetical protein